MVYVGPDERFTGREVNPRKLSNNTFNNNNNNSKENWKTIVHTKKKEDKATIVL
jgi:hypothetical protein